MDLTFIFERYNYWIFIVLMMTGLYIVISRGNLVKKIVGLNIFQTSVFIYYISMGKIAGGTAPILVGGEGGEHGDMAAAQAASNLHEGAANDLAGAIEGSARGGGTTSLDGLHAAPSANSPFAEAQAAASGPAFETAHGDAAAGGGDALHQAADIVYSNPLPHVLILTAIVVGVATTAVGLALAVRIREAYGTVEEDELEAADDIAEFGARSHARAQAGDAAPAAGSAA